MYGSTPYPPPPPPPLGLIYMKKTLSGQLQKLKNKENAQLGYPK